MNLEINYRKLTPGMQGKITKGNGHIEVNFA